MFCYRSLFTSFPPCSTHVFYLMSPTCLHGSDSCSDISSSRGILFATSTSSLYLVDCWDGAIVTCINGPKNPLPVLHLSDSLSDLWCFELSPSTHESNAVWILNTPFSYRKFHQILYSLNMLMTGLWLYIPFFVSWPLPVRLVSHLWALFTLCVQVSGSFSTSLPPNPGPFNQWNAVFQTA